jgi:thioredoxin reductase (NADPH)
MGGEALSMPYDTIVVGGSAAGLTAGLYSSRQGMKTLLVTKDVGGQMLLTKDIENYPGFSSIGGFELANKFKEQAESYGTEFVYDEVLAISEDADCPDLCFKVKTGSSEFHTATVILAFGKTPRDLEVKGEAELKGKGVSYCAVCDGPLFKGKNVAVTGSGDQALEAANYLSGVASRVTLIHAHEKPIGSEELVAQVLGLPNVRSVPNSRVRELQGSSKLERIIVESTANDGRTESIDSSAIFVEVGYTAKTGFLRDLVRLNEKKEIEVDKGGKTSRPGIFAAGDVTDTPYKQAVISAAQGCAAALSAYNYLQRRRGKPAGRADWRSIKPVAPAAAAV